MEVSQAVLVGLQAAHGERKVRSYTANRRELRFGVVAAQTASRCLLAMGLGVDFRSNAAAKVTVLRVCAAVEETP